MVGRRCRRIEQRHQLVDYGVRAAARLDHHHDHLPLPAPVTGRVIADEASSEDLRWAGNTLTTSGMSHSP
jgi:hypothetical protein